MSEMENEPKEPLVLDDEKNLLLEHDADGIRELDNNLPRWWVWLFYLTTIYAVGYMSYYHVFGIGKSSAENYEAAMVVAEKIKAEAAREFVASMATLPPSDDEVVVASGKQVYMSYCVACHRPDGGGVVGPNLCDDYWIHGSTFTDSLNIIMNGNPVKGMLAWKETLPPKDIYAVASYIYTLRGSNPPNPKPAENQAPAEDEFLYE